MSANEPATLERPKTVLIGCILAWFGAAILVVRAVALLGTDKNSSSIDQDASADDIDLAVKALHTLGVFVAMWAVLLAVVVYLAFRGSRRATTVLVGIAVVGVIYGLLVLLTISPFDGFNTILVTVTSTSLIRFRQSSRAWYAAVAESRTSPA